MAFQKPIKILCDDRELRKSFLAHMSDSLFSLYLSMYQKSKG